MKHAISLKFLGLLTLVMVILPSSTAFGFGLVEMDVDVGTIDIVEASLICQQENVQSVADLDDPPGNCNRTVCGGNFWGKTATDICVEEGLRIEGEGEDQRTFKVHHVRRPRETISTEEWIEFPIQIQGPQEEIHPLSMIELEREPFSFLDIIEKVAHADPPASVPWEPAERVAVADVLELVAYSINAALTLGDPRYVGEEDSELRLYVQLAYQTVLWALRGVDPTRYACPPGLEEACNSMVAFDLVWTPRVDRGSSENCSVVGTAGGPGGAHRITVTNDRRLQENPDHVGHSVKVIGHEADHVLTRLTGRLTWLDPGETDLFVSRAEAWRRYMNEANAYIVEAIVYAFLPDEIRNRIPDLGRNTLGAIHHYAMARWGLLEVEPALARAYWSWDCYVGRYAFALMDNASRIDMIIEHLGVVEAAEYEAYRYVGADESANEIGMRAAYLFVREAIEDGTYHLWIDGFENSFQNNGGLCGFWAHSNGPATFGELDTSTLCSAAQTSLHGDNADSPDVDSGPGSEGISDEPDPPEGLEDWNAPERPEGVGSSESETAGMPLSCASNRPDEGISNECIEWCDENIDSSGICTDRIDTYCSQNRFLDQNLPTCVEQCETLSPVGRSFCQNNCDRDPQSGDFCGDICDEMLTPWGAEFCRDRCADNPETATCGRIRNHDAEEDAEARAEAEARRAVEEAAARAEEEAANGGSSSESEGEVDDTPGENCRWSALDYFDEPTDLWPFVGQVCRDSDGLGEHPGGLRDNNWVGCPANGSPAPGDWGTGPRYGGGIILDWAYAEPYYCLYTCWLGTQATPGAGNLPACFCSPDLGAQLEGGCHFE